jgi:glycosyltransferase involved in cell wall biosynthesis
VTGSVASEGRRLLVVSRHHPPAPGIGGTRWLAMAHYLRELGYAVTIVASNAWGELPEDADFGVVRVGDLASSKTLRRLFRRGELRTHGFTSLERPPSALVTKVVVPDVDAALWLPAAVKKVRALLAGAAYDCLITTSPPESAHVLGLLLGSRRPAWVVDFRDGWTFEPYREPFPTGIQKRLDRWLERRVVTTADLVTAVTQPIASDLERRLGVRAECVMNGWDPDLEPSRPPLHLDAGTLTFVYTGTLSGGWGRDPGPLLEALGRVRSEPGASPFRLLHVGRLTTQERQLIDSSGAADLVQHLGTVGRAEALALQRSADALVLITSRHSYEAPGKLFEYMAAGRPIIALADGNEAARIVRETNTGVTVPPEDVDAIADAIRRAASGELAGAYAPHGLDLYTYPGPAEKMAEIVEEAIRRFAYRRTSS